VRHKRRPGALNWLLAAAVGVTAGIVVWLVVSSQTGDESPTIPSGDERPTAPGEADDGVAPGAPALAYAQAVQQRAWDQVIDRTLWMQDLLTKAALASSDPDAVAQARERMRRRLRDRTVSGNQVRPEGIRDLYVFVPGARIEVASEDAGRDDLAALADRRTWLRVAFPSRLRAPLDGTGRPIYAMTVGVNVGAAGHVLKANVLGNVEIDRDSFDYKWPGASAIRESRAGGSTHKP